MKPRLLSRAWIFVSHSTKDITKVRSIRNRLESVGAEPLIFRLKFLDQKPAAIPTMLRAEMRARQFFLLCRSKNSKASRWVEDEINYINTLSNKAKFVIDLDHPTVGRSASIHNVLRRVTIVLAYSWIDRGDALALVRRITSDGVPRPDGLRAAVVDGVGADDFDEPFTLDYGIRGLDDRERKDGKSWEDAAIAASESGEVFVLLAARHFDSWTQLIEDSDGLHRIRSRYARCFILDPSQTLSGRAWPMGMFREADWTLLKGTLEEQLQQLVRDLRLREIVSDSEWLQDTMLRE